MPSVCFYFEVHQPMRLNRFSVFNIGKTKSPYHYFDNTLNHKIFDKVARKCYLPANNVLLDLIDQYDGKFKISFSLTGTFVEYCQKFMPEVIDSFQHLVDTGSVSLIEETYFHSLSSLYDDLDEFKDQVMMHKHLMKDLFNYSPKVFRNTEAIYDNRIAKTVSDMGYQGIITEGAKKILDWRSPNYVYKPINADLRVLLRHYSLSDDIGFRFSAQGWPGFPLTAEKYAQWIAQDQGDIINLFMDYETFGEHQWVETGIFDFLRHLPEKILSYDHLDFVTVNQAVDRFKPKDTIDVPWAISWADEDRDVSTWLGNEMQHACFRELQELGPALKKKNDPKLVDAWRKLQTSDHLYYISTKGFEDGNVHQYFSHYDNPYDGFINYMNILQDFKQSVSDENMLKN
ncbi:MAG: glycoside hydrolase family 57 protein [Candidatus Thermoplasmatota archaeon]|nr:glycoside hydrolase family 57 protein [Candidatus Thermoplasmatota archaeon]MBS3801548.1 glycoside hydrolase family 57 protein [Candidatus Thermoplasmatota archaeon]